MYSSRGLKAKIFGDPHQKRAQTWERTNEWVKQQSDVTYTDSTLASDHVQSQKSKGKLYNPNYARNQREIMIPPYRETTGIVKFQVGSTGCGPLGEIQITKGLTPQGDGFTLSGKEVGNKSGELNLNGAQGDKVWNYKAQSVISGKLDLQRVKRDPQWEVPSGGYSVYERHPEVGPLSFTRLGEASAKKENLSTSGIENAIQHMGGILTQLVELQQEFNYGMVKQLRIARDTQLDQVKALAQLAETSKQRELDKLYDNIPIYDGEDPDKFEVWLNQLENACLVGKRDPRKVAICSSMGALSEVIRSIDAMEPWSTLKAELRRCFSPCKTTVHAVDLLDRFRHQHVNENLRSYIKQYVQLHSQATGLSPGQDYDIGRKTGFLKRLRNPVLANKIIRSAAFKNFDAYSLEKCFGRALELERDFQVSEVVTHI